MQFIISCIELGEIGEHGDGHLEILNGLGEPFGFSLLTILLEYVEDGKTDEGGNPLLFSIPYNFLLNKK